MNTKLWKFNRVTGFWVFVRDCQEDTAKQWLEVFTNDDPKGVFKLSRSKPRLPNK